MKKLLLSLFIVFAFILVGFVDPYASRIRPFAAVPLTCAENEIGYSMSLHKLYICTNAGYKEVDIGGAGSFAPVDAKYIVETADPNLTNEFALGSLATGILKNTTTTGVPTIAAAGDVDSILPTQTGNTGKYLTTNGTNSFWGTVSASVTSVFGRTGAVVAASNDYTFAQLASIPTTFSGYGISDTSANFFSAITNETGSGLVVGSISPTFTGTVVMPLTTFSVGNTTSAQTDLLINPTTKASGNLIDAQVNSVSQFKITSSGSLTITGALAIGNNQNLDIPGVGTLALGSAGAQAKLSQAGNGILKLTDDVGAAFNRIDLGGTTSSFPAIKRNGAGIDFKVADDSAYTSISASFVQQTATRCFLAADQTTTSTTFANINNCSISVTSGRKYTFSAVFYISDSVAADGAKIDFNGGAATATNFRAHCTAFDSALNLSSQGTTLSTAFAASTFTGSGMFECYGTFEPSSSSTFIPRVAQNAHTTGTLTLARGSHLLMEDMP